MEVEELEIIERNIRILHQEIWSDKIYQYQEIEDWLSNFKSIEEQHNALYLLSKFTYLGHKEVNVLLKTLYRDKIKYPIIEEIRKNNQHTTDIPLINKKYNEALLKRRFLGIGNPSESGIHLLYFFRQINSLPKNLFIHSHEIFDFSSPIKSFQNDNIEEYIFIDDFCGSGNQAKRYSKLVNSIKVLNPQKKISYYVLVATEKGLRKIIEADLGYDTVDAIFKLDTTFKCFSDESRYFNNCPLSITKDFLEQMCQIRKELLKYTEMEEEVNPFGFDNCQLLLSFFHNTPNNSLPIFWFEDNQISWTPIFRRYPKIYSIK